ncbi:MAG: hypothetical protein GY876_10080 [Planctomycetes bacterium]|jgi:hypothetical protein|nr:hypothetical protein [Planctomycetota bacterium]
MITPILLPMLLGNPAEVVFPAPDFDRWNYGFNTADGTRGVGSTFSAFQSGYPFDDRDGQVLLGFVTGAQIEQGLPPRAYHITSCRLEVSLASDDIPYDSTPDSWQTHHASGEADADDGRPTHLSGVAFRNGWDGWSFGEDGDFGEVMASGVRNCYPIDFDDSGAPRDISNSVTQEFDSNVWAIGVTDEVAAGEIIPAYAELTFAVDVNDPDIRCYVRNALAEGLLEFMVTSLHPASEPGSGGEANYPDWVLKENPLVELGVTSAASLMLTVEIVPPSGVVGDVTGDGLVNVEDLLATLKAFGRCPCCDADLDESGVVDVNDLLAVIAGWGV